MELQIETADIAKFADKFSLGRDRGMDSRQFLRVKVPAGRLTSEQLRVIAELSDKYGRGYAEITDRQDIQLHWVQGKDAPEIFAKLDELGFTTDKCGQSYPGPRYGDTRNVCVCPVAGINRHELIDVAPIAKKINDFFTGNLNYLDLPRKFKISITGCELGCTRPEIQDLGLFAVRKGGEVGFFVLVGGSMGPSQPGPRLAKPLGVFIRPDEVFDVTKAMVDFFNERGNRESKPKARIKWMVHEGGVEKIREGIEAKLGRKLERFEHGSPSVSGEEHIGIQEQQDGNYFVAVPVIGGVLSSGKLRGIASASEKFGKGEIRLTPYQNFVLPHVQKEKIGAALEWLVKVGLPVGGSPLRWTTVACASDFCGKSVEPHPKQVAGRLVDRLEKRFGDKLGNLELLVHFSGCLHDCGLHRIGQIGVIGVKAASAGEIKQLYTLSVGGALGTKSAFAQPIRENLSPDQVILAVEKLVAACVDEGFDDFGEFCRSRPLEALKSIAAEV
ncbi:MAG: nitrite/sulfite reductase [Candidatus Hadarchaeota archaeon]